MLLFVVSLLVWLPALAGWALPWAWLRARLGGPGPEHLDGGDGVAAIALLAAMGLLLNFVWPLNATVSLSVAALGWLLGAWRWSRTRFQRPSRRHVLHMAAAVLLAALLANFPPDALDSGLYHYQGLAWARQYPAPLGLANLHGRLAFNTSTAPLAALTQLPLWDSAANSSQYVLGALFLSIYLAELLTAWRRPAARTRRSTIFLTIGAVVLASAPTWSTRIAISSYSPTSDWPILVLTLLALALTLRALEEPTALNAGVAGTLLIAAVGLTIKLSAAPLLAVPAALAVYARQRRLPLAQRTLMRLGFTLLLGLGLPWLARSVVLSGCLVYPAPFTCMPALPWAVTPAGALGEAKWIVSWARLPGPNLALTLHGWGWLPGWWAGFIHDRLVIAAAALSLAGLAAWGLAANRATPADDRAAALVAGGPVLAGLAAWFFTAPDVRFAAGYLWGAALLAAAFGWQRLAAAGPRGAAWLLRRAGVGVAALLLFGLILVQGRQSLAYLARTGPQAYFLAWPLVDRVETETRATLHGDVVQVPVGRDECWLAELPCTPYFNAYLRIDHTPSGAPRQFSIAPAP